MALAILDGTQTATTLSTILSSGQHITAHTVVSLGTQAITDMRSAVSGSVVSVSSLPPISGTVTANVTTLAFTTQGGIASSNSGSIPTYGIQLGYNNSDGEFNLVDVTNGYPIRGSVAVKGLDTLENQTQIAVTTSGSVLASLSSALPAGTNTIGTVTVGNTVTIAGTVTANIAISSTAITSGSFASLTSATLVPANTARKMATVFNQGAGQLFVNAGATATTAAGGFMVALSSGDFYECNYTTTTLSAIFATAGTASWVSH